MASFEKEERTNCYQVFRLLIDGGKELLVKFLLQSTHPLPLDVFLSAGKDTLQKVCRRNPKPILCDSQWDILYPPNGVTDTTKWDITLTSCVLINTLPSTDQKNQAIKDIRTIRNEYEGHIGAFKMNNSEFSIAWTRIEQVLNHGARVLLKNPSDFDLQAILDAIKKEEIENVDELKETFCTWAKKDILLNKAVNELGEELRETKITVVELMKKNVEVEKLHQETYHEVKAIGEEVNKTTMAVAKHSKDIAEMKSHQEGHGTREKEFKALLTDLVEYYTSSTNSITKAPVVVQSSYNETDIDDIYADPHLVIVDHKAVQPRRQTKIDVTELFQEVENRCKRIYISGEAGTGKTSLCKHLIKAWCNAHSKPEMKKGINTTMKNFEYLFFISLGKAKKQYEIRDMIVSQIFTSDKRRTKVLDQLLADSSEKCLIILDGLDEWASEEGELPGRNNFQKYTTLTTSRPWKVDKVTKETDIDKKLYLKGVECTDKFGETLVSFHNKQQGESKSYTDFLSSLNKHRLGKMKDVPIIYKQLISLWLYGEPFGKSKARNYAQMIDLLFELAEKRQGVAFFDVTDKTHDDFELPNCFENLEKCKLYQNVLCSLAELAYKHYYETQNSQVAIEASIRGQKELKICLDVGILRRNIVFEKVYDKSDISFLQKSFRDLFAALFASTLGKNNIHTEIGKWCKSVDDVFNLEDLFQFICGMCPSLMTALSKHIVKAINEDKEFARLRTVTQKKSNSMKPSYCQLRLQSLVLSLCNECSNSTIEHSGGLPLPDVIVQKDLSVDDCHTLRDCLLKHPQEVRSLWCSDLQNTTEVICIDGYTKEYPHTRRPVELSSFTNLYRLTVNLSSSELKHNQISYLMAIISQVCSLQYIDLESLNCEEHKHDAICGYTIDLSENNHLKYLRLVDLPPGHLIVNTSLSLTNCFIKMTLTKYEQMLSLLPNVLRADSSVYSVDLKILEGCPDGVLILNRDCSESSVTVKNTQFLKYCQICHLIDNITHAHSLTNIHLESVNSQDHVGEADSCYKLDISGRPELKELHLENISPGHVVLYTPNSCSSLEEITVKNIQPLTHDQICGMTSGISHSSSLKRIQIESISSEHQFSEVESGYTLDLSGHTELEMLHLQNIPPVCLVLNTNGSYSSLTDLTMKDIPSLPHDQIGSLMACISQLQSLRLIDLESVNCKDHGIDGECIHTVDLMGNDNLETLRLVDLPLCNVVVHTTISLTKCVLELCICTNDQILSLLSMVLQAKSLNSSSVDLKIITDERSGDVVLAGSSVEKSISMKGFNALTYNQIYDLMVKISQTQALVSIKLESVSSEHQIEEVESGYTLDLSGHTYLEMLHLKDISPGCIVLYTPDDFYSSLTYISMEDIHSLTREQIECLMGVISQTHSLESIILKSIKAKDQVSEAESNYTLDVSEHNVLSRLCLSDISLGTLKLKYLDWYPKLSFISISSIDTFTHSTISALIENVSRAHQSMNMSLVSIRCVDYANGVECGKQIDREVS